MIALTKSDLGRLDVVTNEIREHLSGTPFAESPIVPTSVRSGMGIEKLVNTLTVKSQEQSPNATSTSHACLLIECSRCAASAQL